MYTEIHVATNSICGVTGCVHPDYRSQVTAIHPIFPNLERIDLLLTDDMPKPQGSARKLALVTSLIAPRGLQNYREYRLELYRQITKAGY
jgi:hypothetical protein